MLLDSAQPYGLHYSDSAAHTTLRLPVDWVNTWLADPQSHCGLRIDAASGWGQTLSSFVSQLTPELATGPPLPAKLMTDQLGSLLALGAHDVAPDEHENTRTVTAFVHKAAACVQQRHAEIGLTAQVVAQELYISERTLHRYFARSGTTFLQQLMKARMDVAQRMLRDSRFDRLTVSEIGRRVGFGDASHFIRHCRASLGITPALLRRSR